MLKLEIMDNTQKQILRDIANRLDQSTYTDWNTGDLDDWSEYGKKMKSVIVTVTPIINTIANGVDEPQETKDVISVDEIEFLRSIYNRMMGWKHLSWVDELVKMDKILKKLE